ncbi:MAG TPA: cytochrome c3 family protein [Vicinamibacterales bacterium]|nr:cytochrome c3 family protein [Vicinamibacterales bacterium]
MTGKILTIVLLVAALMGTALLASRIGSIRIPGNQQGYEPAQPIAFSHRLHAGELQVPCLYCHSGAEKSRNAGIPAVSTCVNCHRFVTAPFGSVREEDELATKEARKPRLIVSPELKKLYDAMAVNPDGMLPIAGGQPTPIRWTKIHNVPDFVYFDHRAHVTAGVLCQQCHGPVETMERVRQMETLEMGWCVNCHRQVNQTGVAGRSVYASTDCATCHY